MSRDPRVKVPAAPPASGVRLEWSAVPAQVRSVVEEGVGAAVESAVTQPGGFSPGVAARVRLSDGRRVFMKAAGPVPNAEAPDFHRSEARITAALPASAPVPRLLHSFDVDGWVVLVLEDVDGRMPAQPWRSDELLRVLSAAADLAALLDPSPIEAPSVADRFGGKFRGWRQLSAAFRDGADDLGWLDPWARRYCGRLAEREDDWTASATGGALNHGDLRADNVLLTETGVAVVDWPSASVGAPWFDVVGMGPSVIMQGAPDAITVLNEHLAARGADAEAVTTVLIAVAGYFLHQASQPAPPGLPTLRAFQLAQGDAALSWLRQRTDWP
jgi:aminoglycoside phosphotransferase (APT) family kinase protein